MNFEYRGEKYGMSKYGESFYFYTQKLIDKQKPQIRLKAKTFKDAEKEVHKLIDKKLSAKK